MTYEEYFINIFLVFRLVESRRPPTILNNVVSPQCCREYSLLMGIFIMLPTDNVAQSCSIKVPCFNPSLGSFCVFEFLGFLLERQLPPTDQNMTVNHPLVRVCVHRYLGCMCFCWLNLLWAYDQLK